MDIRQELLEILVCPGCKLGIYLTESEDGLLCDRCNILFPIKDGIAVMILDQIDKSEKK